MNFRQSYKLAALAGLLCCSTGAWAQPQITDAAQVGKGNTDEPVTTDWKPSLVRDGAYDRVPHTTKALAWQPLREADILWKKRVWREIDTRERQNLAFRYPGDDQTGGGYFIEILLDAVKKGKLKAYSTFDDRFTTAMSKEEVLNKLTGGSDTTTQIDPITGEEKQIIQNKEFDVDAITSYRVKEDWMFDRNLGRMVVRIIGIAPIINVMDPTSGELRATTPLMWIYYPEARPVFAQYEVFNPENDVQRLTWDDYLEGRYWNGRIIQVSSADQRTFANSGLTPMESLYQSQIMTDRVYEKEHDMWVY